MWQAHEKWEKKLPCQTWACCSCLWCIDMHPSVLLQVCLTYWVVLQVKNSPWTTLSTCLGISEGQTSATFSQHLPLMVWMILQFLVLLEAAGSTLINKSRQCFDVFSWVKCFAVFTDTQMSIAENIPMFKVNKTRNDWKQCGFVDQFFITLLVDHLCLPTHTYDVILETYLLLTWTSHGKKASLKNQYPAHTLNITKSKPTAHEKSPIEQ